MSNGRSRIPRRSMIGLGSLVLAGCGRGDDGYFGNTRPPAVQRLVFENHAEPETVDPAKAMPFIPLSTSVWPSPAKPYLKGISGNLVDGRQFKYVRIDRNRRAS